MVKFRISEVFRNGYSYDIITKYKEIPVKVHLKLNWIDNEGRLLGFDWGRTHLKPAFSTLDPVYVRVEKEEYAQTQVFSNLGKELVLMVDNFVGPPEFIKRRSVRVEPDEHKPVMVEIFHEEGKLKATVADISELGIGLIVAVKENENFVSILKERLKALKKEECIEYHLKIFLPSCGIAQGKGKLKNVISLDKDSRLKLGFEINFPQGDLNTIRRYVINRQKEIIKSLRIVK